MNGSNRITLISEDGKPKMSPAEFDQFLQKTRPVSQLATYLQAHHQPDNLPEAFRWVLSRAAQEGHDPKWVWETFVRSAADSPAVKLGGLNLPSWEEVQPVPPR